MPTDSTASFAQLCREYRLLEPAQLEELQRRLLSHFRDGRELIRDLVRRGWLTPWQGNQIVQGRAAQLLLGSYVLLDRLGEGGMGTVYKARNWKLGRIVAVKVIRKERLDSDLAIRRFHREIEAAAQLSHPNIVHAFDADDVDGTHLFVMEFVEGRDLAHVVKERGPLPIAAACDYVRQAALGLQHAFERGLVHRDIKPANLLLTHPDGVVKLLDMGLARMDKNADTQSSTLTQEGAVMGTPDFMAPEQARDSHSADIRADLYSLGCTLFFLLTAKAPFPGGSLTDKLLRHQIDAPPPIRTRRPEVSETLARLIDRLLAKSPEQRYQTPAELIAALDAGLGEPASPPVRTGSARPLAADTVNPFADLELRGGETIETHSTDAGGTARRASPWTRWPVLAGVFGVLLMSAVMLALLLPSRKQPPRDDANKRTDTKGTVRLTPPEKMPREVPDKKLFDGKDLSGWVTRGGQPAAWKVEDNYMEVQGGDIMTEEKFGPDFRLHLEFWLPLMETASGQGRANSGVFLQGRYEIQILDSYLNDTYANGSVGALYGILAPDEEAQRKAIKPPEQWNSYDITFHSPRINDKGELTEKGRLTVVLNGITLIDDGKFDRVTGGAINNQLGEPGPLLLQDHGCRVRYRNIWLQPLSEREETLFNGKNLSGWEGSAEYWRVKDGAIIGTWRDDLNYNTFLCSKKTYSDFELSFKVRLKDGKGNSGVQFRSKLVDAEKFIVAGPQAEIGDIWGGLYGERAGGWMKQSKPELVAQVVKPNDFNDYSIKCVGKHVIIKINGETMIEDVFPTMADEGIIAWQLHGGFGAMEVAFKDILFTDLSKAEK